MGTPDDLHKRLKELNRRSLPQQESRQADIEGVRRKLRKLSAEAPPPSRSPDAIVYRRDLPRAGPRAVVERPRATWHVDLEEAVAGAEVSAPDGGKVYLIEERLAERGQEWGQLCASFGEALRAEGAGARRRLCALCEREYVAPEDLVFFDLETTGLAGTPLFLIGTMTWEDGGLTVRQYLARDYSEERAAIALFLEATAGRTVLVSFNGKTFDLPYIRVRAAATGVPFRVDAAHVDLLHECRRAWGGSLPNCRLQTLEGHICGRYRYADIPGHLIPQAYHDFVRTRNAAEIVEVLRHNLLDLATLAELLTKLP